MDIGSKLKELKNKSKMTVSDLAQKTNLSTGYLNKLLNNDRGCTIETLEEVCKVFGLTLGEFFSDDTQVNFEISRIIIKMNKLEKSEYKTIENLIDMLIKNRP